MKASVLVVAIALGVAACGKSSPSETTAAPPVAAPAGSAIPTEEDYEVKAAATITPTNANDELTKLEKEIGTTK